MKQKRFENLYKRFKVLECSKNNGYRALDRRGPELTNPTCFAVILHFPVKLSKDKIRATSLIIPKFFQNPGLLRRYFQMMC